MRNKRSEYLFCWMYPIGTWETIRPVLNAIVPF